MRCALAIPVCVFALLPCLPQQSRPSTQQPTFRGGVDVVEVDVQALDGSGRPVTDLKPEEFAITVEGKPRTVVAASYAAHGVNASATPAPAPDKPRPLFTSNWIGPTGETARTILIVVDEANIRSGDARQATFAAERFLDGMQPDDRVGLVSIPRSAISVAPTTDRASVKRALKGITGHDVGPDTRLAMVRSLGQSEAFARRHDAKLWEQIFTRECIEDPGTHTAGSGNADPNAVQACRSELEAYAVSMMGDVRQRQAESVAALVSLMDALAQLPGPKTVVLVSQQLPVPPYQVERSDFYAAVRPLELAAARARATVYVVQLNLPVFDVEQRADLPTAGADADMASFGLETVTSVTGGKRFMVSGTPQAVLDRVAVEISGSYIIGFRSEASDRDGKGHEVKVAVARRGVEVRARKTFAYPAITAPADANARDAVNRLLRAATTEANIPISVATYAIVDPGSTASPQMRVLITAEIDKGATKETPLTVGYVITGGVAKNEGTSVEQVTLKPAAGHPDSPLVYTAAAVVPPGVYTLRLAVADGVQRAGSVSHYFEARPVDAGGARLSDLIVFDPYVAEPGRSRPSVSATVGGELACYLEAYPGTGKAPENVSARLELADAPEAAPRTTVPLDIQPPDNHGRVRLIASLPLADVPPGDYIARAVILSAGTPIGRVTRPVHVVANATPSVAPSLPAPTPAAPPSAPAQGGQQPSEPAATPPPATASYSAPAATVEELLPRVARYVREYGEQLSIVIATEKYSQWQQYNDAPRPTAKQLVSEFALVRNGSDWEGYRDVYQVDGKPVPDRQDRLMKLITESPATVMAQGRRIADESARYNMGVMQRNFNTPTVALFFFNATNQPRFKFKKDGEDRVSGVLTWRLKFEESKKPTIIRTAQGKDMPVKGEVWADPLTGRVMKTHMQMTSEAKLTADYGKMSNEPSGFIRPTEKPLDLDVGNRRVLTSASVTVTYKNEPKLGLLVPGEMLESYESPYVSRFSGQEGRMKINCVANYENFRRFETSGKLVAPK